MSFINNDKLIQNQVNALRIKLKLRILWPDFQIYDLLGQDCLFHQIQQLASFPPLIIKLDMENLSQNQLLISKQFTHIAISKKLQISAHLKVSQVIYAILTNRNIAIDQINCRYLRGKHCLAVQVAQLNRQFSLWGAEVVTNTVQTVNPKFIIKRNSIWHLQFQFESSIKSIVLYSTRRQPNYQKTNAAAQLPKDATKEICLKFRCFTSVLDGYFNKNKDQIMVEQFSGAPLFISSQGFWQGKALKKEEETLSSFLEEKCKIIHTSQQQESKPSKNTKDKVTIRIEDQPYFLQIQDKFDLANFVNRNLAQIKEIVSQLDQRSEKIFQKLVQNQINSSILLQSFKQLKEVTFDQKMQFQKGIKMFQNEVLNDFIYGILILDLDLHNCQINRKKWLKLFKLGKEVLNSQLKQLSLSMLKNILILHSAQILKDSDDELQQFEELLGPQIFTLIVKAMFYHEDNGLVLSDLLFILMKIQKCKNIFQLYDQNILIDNSVFVAESISSKIQKLRLPSNKNLNISYQIDIDPLSFECPQSSKGLNQSTDILCDHKKYQTKIKKLVKKACFVSQIIKDGKATFIAYLIRQQQSLNCFIECIEIKKNSNSTGLMLQSYNMRIQVKTNQIIHVFTFGWNFSLSSNAVGCKFKVNFEQFEDFELTIYMKKQIVHQSIMNFLNIRYAELMKFPKSILVDQKNKSKENERLSKRRSTFQLQSAISIDQIEPIPIQCFLHRKCVNCQRLLKQKNLYEIKPIDMLSLLTVNQFAQEINSLFVYFKYLSIHLQQLKSHQSLMYAVRINYIPLKDMLHLYNHFEMKQQLSLILKHLIQHRLKLDMVAPNNSKINRMTIDPFFLKGRRLEEIRKFIEKQYTPQLLQYLKKTKKA